MYNSLGEWGVFMKHKHKGGSGPRIMQDRQLRQSPWIGILDVFRQLQTERNLRKRHVCYRTTQPAHAAEAYQSMSEDEFDSINGPQEWQNRRFIPRLIQSLRLSETVLAVDLG